MLCARKSYCAQAIVVSIVGFPKSARKRLSIWTTLFLERQLDQRRLTTWRWLVFRVPCGNGHTKRLLIQIRIKRSRFLTREPSSGLTIFGGMVSLLCHLRQLEGQRSLSWH